ncbi:hypothetical protein [Hymenobacter tenuis]
MSFLGALCCSLLLGACQEANTKQEDDLVNRAARIEKAQRKAAAAAEENDEYLEWNTVTIGGKQPLLGKTQDLYQALGQPDSLVSPNLNEVCTSFYSRKFQYAHFKQSLAEVYGDTAVLESIDFRHNPGLALHTPSITLTHNTTMAELSKLFPLAVKAQNAVTVDGFGKVRAVRLATGKTPADDAWLLFFDKGKLIRIDHWMPC